MNWKPLTNFENYLINERGQVKNKHNKYLKEHEEKGKRSNIKSRYYYKLRKNGKNYTIYTHRAVATVFIPHPENKPEVNHIDGDPSNNHVSNLEWVTRKENIRHAFENGLIKTSKPVLQYSKQGKFLQEFPSESMACRCLGVNQGKVRNAIKRQGTCKGYVWKYKVNA